MIAVTCVSRAAAISSSADETLRSLLAIISVSSEF
jgi:hypothetical protein